MNVLDHLSNSELGQRLRIARENAKYRQEDAAEKLGMSRTTVVAIEKGDRRARIEEVRAFAQLYSTSINSLLREEAVHVDLAPRFRKHFGKKDDAVEDAVKLFAELAQAEVELESLLGVTRINNYPPERPLMPGDVRAQAEHDATELRQWLGLGLSPVTDIVTLLELEMGVRVYIRRFDGAISGLFAYDDKLGACILLNANHPRERRTQTAAHELGHFISTRRQPEVLSGERIENSREERYAAAFAAAFLTPARAVMQKFKEVTAGSEKLTRRHAIILAHAFGVSREAIVRRLEDLGLAKKGTWDWFVHYGSITDDHVWQVLGDLRTPDEQKADADRPTSLRLALLADEVSRRGLMSEGQLARMLHLDRVELRAMLDGLQVEGSEADEAFLPG
ncbi:MAG: ImmA/IrrE family metallo-endopeptidase [Bradyrhizobiaceae bacterium]|nr:ImmA/IrrE family metallo-endopeptidase [Bradyrhizobiaceae bacterium]